MIDERRFLNRELPLGDKENLLRGTIGDYREVVVAFSGGVDSSLLCLIAYQQLQDRARAAIAVSPSLSVNALNQARVISQHIGISLDEVETHEVALPAYVINDSNRCYHCRDVTFGTFVEANPGSRIVAGFQLDDLGERRPGLLAAKQLGVSFPLMDSGFGKNDVRNLAKVLGLPNWDIAADACLSSRFETGVMITEDRLLKVGEAEAAIREIMGIDGDVPIRIRILSEGIRFEVDERLRESAITLRDQIKPILDSLSFGSEVYFGPYRSGSANKVIGENQNEF